MPEDWADVSSPRERVRTIVESMQMSRTSEWVAEQAEVDEDTAQEVLEEMVDGGEIITWTRESDGQVYATNDEWQLVDFLRDIGDETDDGGICIPNEVVSELESSRPGGEPRIDRTTVTVREVYEAYARDGLEPAEVAHEYDVELARVHEAIAYYYDHADRLRGNDEL